ncbi:MAG: methyltransferase family protein [Chthoniobacterales bacterium]
MDSLVNSVITTCWVVFFVVWIVAAKWTKRTAYRETPSQRLRYVVPIVIGWILVARGRRFGYPLNVKVIPHTPLVLAVAAILCACGVVFCVWARIVLGRNWSGTVTVKEGHELIVRGPYRLVRHPIYTGLLVMLVATAIQHGRIAAMIGVTLVFVSFWIKLSGEEELMLKQFPNEYAAYRRRVKRIIPFVI